MKMATTFFVLGFCWALNGCKTSQSNNSADSPSSGSQLGLLDSDNKMVLPIPEGLTVPTTQSSQATMGPSASAGVSGLGLAETNVQNYAGGGHAPVNTEAEGITSACWSIDTRFPNANWQFWAQLTNTSTNKPVQSTTASIANCGDIQIALTNLLKTAQYKIDAAIYYQTSPTGPSVVWYQGSTAPFTPGDRQVNLELLKLLQDEQVNVNVQQSPAQMCNLSGYFWTGYSCLNQPQGIVFTYTSTADIADPTTVANEKCLQLDSAAELMTCTFNSDQLFTLNFYQKGVTTPTATQTSQGIKATSENWYYIVVGQETIVSSTGAVSTTQNQCLTAKLSTNTLVKAPCLISATNGTVDSSQLFTLTPSTPNDNAGQNTFRISRMDANNLNPLCVGVPPSTTGPQGTSPFYDMAPISLVSCNQSNAALTASQFVQFLTANDFGNPVPTN